MSINLKISFYFGKIALILSYVFSGVWEVTGSHHFFLKKMNNFYNSYENINS